MAQAADTDMGQAQPRSPCCNMGEGMAVGLVSDFLDGGVGISIDVDAMDMSLVPGCVSAEPNGLTYPELRDSLKAIAERHDIAGFDFVEVNPPLDVGTGVTAYLGALTVVEFLGNICAQPRWTARRNTRRAA